MKPGIISLILIAMVFHGSVVHEPVSDMLPAHGLSAASIETQASSHQQQEVDPTVTEQEHWLAFGALYEVVHHQRVEGYDQLYCEDCRCDSFLVKAALKGDWELMTVRRRLQY